MFDNDIVFLQRILRAAGFYTKAIDGINGAGTKAGLVDFQKSFEDIAVKYGKFDVRSEIAISTLLPRAQELARQHLALILKAGYSCEIINATRTYIEQAALYASGRTKAGIIVTNAKAGYSWHNFGLAWDIGFFEGKHYLAESSSYTEISSIGIELGLEWGGSWKSIVDVPHYQLKIEKTITQVRKLFESGKLVI